MPLVKKTASKRKCLYDSAPFPKQKDAKRRRVTTRASVTTAREDKVSKKSPDRHVDQTPYAFYSPEKYDLSSFLADKRKIRSAKRRFVFNSAPCSIFSLNKELSFPKEPKATARETSRKRPLSHILDNSIEETVINGKPANKKHRIVLSDSMQEDFYLTDDDDDETEADCDKSADDIFEKETDSPVKHKIVKEVNCKQRGCKLTSCRKHSNPDKNPESCFADMNCSCHAVFYCPVEIERLVDDCEKKTCLFSKYANEYHTVLKAVDYGQGRSPSVYLYGEALLTLCNRQQRSLHIDRTFKLGNCYVTMFVFRNANLTDTRSKKKYSPLMLGPVMLHFDTENVTYTRFFEFVKQKTCIKYNFNPELNRKVSKRDEVIANAIRTVFGTAVPLCDIYHQHGYARRVLRENMKCFDSLYKVIEIVTLLMNCERSESKKCLQKSSLWKMVPCAKLYMSHYMDKPFPMKYLDDLSLECSNASQR